MKSDFYEHNARLCKCPELKFFSRILKLAGWMSCVDTVTVTW